MSKDKIKQKSLSETKKKKVQRTEKNTKHCANKQHFVKGSIVISLWNLVFFLIWNI